MKHRNVASVAPRRPNTNDNWPTGMWHVVDIAIITILIITMIVSPSPP